MGRERCRCQDGPQILRLAFFEGPSTKSNLGNRAHSRNWETLFSGSREPFAFFGGLSEPHQDRNRIPDQVIFHLDFRSLRELSIFSVGLWTGPRGACRPSRELLRVLVSLQLSTYPRPTSAKPVRSVSREERLPLAPFLELSCIRRD